jgi:plasmid replication initiation protein
MVREAIGPQSIDIGSSTVLDDRIEALRRKQRERKEAAIRSVEAHEHASKTGKESYQTAPITQSVNLDRKGFSNEEQPYFHALKLYEAGTRDSRNLMDVALFRLSKRYKRAGDVIRHDLPDGYVEVSAGAYGMASIWDYDIVLMMVSHLTEAMNQYRKGKGEKPGRVFRSHISDILKFTRRGDGSRQVQELEAALDRLRGTTIKTVREKGKLRCTEAEGLIASYRVLSRTSTKKISYVEIEAPEWIYREVVESKQPQVLSVHPDYFLIESGIGRYLYRHVRQAAGRTKAKWSFATIYKRSASQGTLKKFTENLRKIITANNLPEYDIREETGRAGPQLIMIFRNTF